MDCRDQYLSLHNRHSTLLLVDGVLPKISTTYALTSMTWNQTLSKSELISKPHKTS